MNSQQRMNEIDYEMERKNELADSIVSSMEFFRKQLVSNKQFEYISHDGVDVTVTMSEIIDDIMNDYGEEKLKNILIARFQAEGANKDFRAITDMQLDTLIDAYVDEALVSAANDEHGVRQEFE